VWPFDSNKFILGIAHASVQKWLTEHDPVLISFKLTVAYQLLSTQIRYSRSIAVGLVVAVAEVDRRRRIQRLNRVIVPGAWVDEAKFLADWRRAELTNVSQQSYKKVCIPYYTVFHKRILFCFFFIIHSNDDQFAQKCVTVVAEEILIRNIATKYGSWLNILC